MSKDIFYYLALQDKDTSKLSFEEKCDLLTDIWIREADTATIIEYAASQLSEFYYNSDAESIDDLIDEYKEKK